MRRNPRAEDWEDDMMRGLNIIATRSEGLSRFLGAYASLAKLPRPRFDPVDVDTWVRRVVIARDAARAGARTRAAACSCRATRTSSISC